MKKNKKENANFISKDDYKTLDAILNKIRIQLNSKITIKDTIDGKIIIQTYDETGIIKSEAKSENIKNAVNSLYNNIY